MEIQGQQANVQSNGSDRALRMREGDIYNAKVKSRISDREAVISVRGQEVKAKFDGKVPDRDRVNVQVQGRTSDGVRVKEVKEESGRQNRTQGREGGQSSERVLRELGHREPSRELRQAAQRLMDRGVPLTRESANALNRYLESGQGTARERSETVQTMARKRLEPTSAQLRAVHEALHGRNSTDQLRDLTREIRSELRAAEGQRAPGLPSSRQDARTEMIRAIDQVIRSLQSGQNVRQAIEQLQQTVQRSGDSALIREVNQALREMLQVQAGQGREAAADRMAALLQQLSTQGQSGAGTADPVSRQSAEILRSSQSNNQQIISQWSSLIQNEGNVRQTAETIRSEMTQAGLAPQASEQLNQQLNEALNRLDSGREMKARQILLTAVQNISQIVPADQSAAGQSDSRAEMQQYMRNEIVQTSGVPANSILITEVTERLAQATDNFKVFQRDAVRQLSRIDTMIQQFRQQAVQQTQSMLDNVIKQLDRAIMKSDWMLYADMKTERRMLGASSRLAEAKKMMARGNHQEARQIVREVQRTLEQVNFRPSNQRVQHMLVQEQEWREPRPQMHRLAHQLDQTARTFTSHDGSARQVFEGMRGLGISRESDLAQMIASGRDISQADQHQRNMKSILMQMARGGEEESGRQQAQQALQNLTGQQLISRTDTQQNLQMLQLHLPVMLKGEAENLQIYVNSRQDGEEIDWENCNLYFHIDTKKLGPLGIVLNVTDRSLSVTLKNDSPQFAEKVEPLAEKYTENLKDVGFHLKGIQFAPMTPPETTNSEEVKQTDDEEITLPVMTEKGFDYKI